MAEPKVCPRCQGKGTLPTDDDMTVRQCICAYSRTLKAHLGSEIALAPLIQSPLYQPGAPGEPPKVDRTTENLFLKGFWSDLLSHLKWGLGCKGPFFRFRVVTDERLKVVYLGAESYAARAKGRRDEVQTYNSLADLVGPDVDLLILRLGFLGHKNVAMAGILKEALMIREAACKPTWLVEVPTSPFGPGHYSYSDEVGDYILNTFEVVDLTPSNAARHNQRQHGFEIPLPLPADDAEDIGLGLEPVQPAVASRLLPRPKAPVPAPPMEEPTLPGEGVGARKSSYKPKRKTSGEGPLG